MVESPDRARTLLLSAGTRNAGLFVAIFCTNVHRDSRLRSGDMERIKILQCRRCTVKFFICHRCYRGQAYCSQFCGKAARKEQCRQANITYMNTERGQERRAAAVLRCRARGRALASASKPLVSASLECNRSRSSFPVPAMITDSFQAICSQCGQVGQVIPHFGSG